jgi:hypothetical protein
MKEMVEVKLGGGGEKSCVIICVFGKQFSTVYQAPKSYPAYCFTNNKDIQAELELKGWKYIYMNFPIFDDPLKSSLQVKFVKFLQFRKASRFSFFNEYENLIFVDHTHDINDENVAQILQRATNKILTRFHPEQPSIMIGDELKRTVLQERYLRNMPHTIDWINKKIKQGYSEYVCIPWGSLILYRHKDPEVQKFADEIYKEIMEAKSPSDQTVWAMVSQKYLDIIQMIEAGAIPMKWMPPGLPDNKEDEGLKKTCKKIAFQFISCFVPDRELRHKIRNKYRSDSKSSEAPSYDKSWYIPAEIDDTQPPQQLRY